jgi:hypothetical protein
MRRWLVVGTVVASLGLLGGCKKQQAASGKNSSEELKPREIGQFSDTGTPATQPAVALEGLPTGTMPQDTVHAPFRPGENMAPQFNPLAEWQTRPARTMTDRVYALPKAEGDPEDGDLALSHLEQHISMQDNLDRWAGMFGYQGEAVAQNAKKQELDGVKFPTTVVDISGTYKSSSMMAPAGPPKENYRMLVAEIRTPQRPYYVRLIGPQKTVAKWEEAYMKFVREAAK